MNDQRPYGLIPPKASRLKRKEREPQLPPVRRPPPPPPSPRTTVPASKTATGSKQMEVTSANNKLVAGYMAYEFLTKGTLLGHKYDAARSEQTTSFNGRESYEEITSLLMMKTTDGGDHMFPGIVNPTQLWRWIEM